MLTLPQCRSATAWVPRKYILQIMSKGLPKAKKDFYHAEMDTKINVGTNVDSLLDDVEISGPSNAEIPVSEKKLYGTVLKKLKNCQC